ncbi:MAG: iron uptake transporter permease EfeU [Chloroflexota bacterium]|jgi:high-affinity iron transporter|nr:FTR1 family protein [Chloroflexota bacterium]
MFVASLLGLREGLEAALVVGIVFGYLRKTGQMQHGRYAWAGVITAIIMSAAIAIGITAIGAELEGTAEQIFEGSTMLLAVIVLTWMIFWMRNQARFVKGELEGKMQKALKGGAGWGLFAISFLSVFREGVETALLLGATAFQSSGMATFIGAMLGLIVAAIIGYLIYASTVRLNLRVFFNITSILLLVFAAGLFAHAVHEFQEAGILPTLIDPVWDISAILSKDSIVGQFLRTLVGYSPAPSLVEVISYIGYWVAILLGMRLHTTLPQRAMVA